MNVVIVRILKKSSLAVVITHRRKLKRTNVATKQRKKIMRIIAVATHIKQKLIHVAVDTMKKVI